MSLNKIKNSIEFCLPNNLKDALVAFAKENGNTPQEEILFRINSSLENTMQASHRFKYWLELRRKTVNKNINISNNDINT
jgi:hypothetical protein